MDSVDTHKNEAQEKTPKINFVQKFFRKLIGYQEPTSYEEILEVITEVVQEELCNVEPEIDYDELSYHIDYGNLSDYVDANEVGCEMDTYDVADYITLDYEHLALSIEYDNLVPYFIDGDMKDVTEKYTKEVELISDYLNDFYKTLAFILKERKV